MIQSPVNIKLLPCFNSTTTMKRTGGARPYLNIVEKGVADAGGARKRSWRSASLFRVKATPSSFPTPPDRDHREEDEDKAAAASSAGFLSRSQTYALLKQQLAIAAKYEDYKEAARIRDSLKFFEDEEPILYLRKMMKKAIDEERFKDAAKYRDELKSVCPLSLLSCSSDATTLGIRVQARSMYFESQSTPSIGQYIFGCKIRITNNSRSPVVLLRRHWIVTDANGRTENIWGIGVNGDQPVILPRSKFEYSFSCPLSTPSGRMEGDFEMKRTDALDLPTFNVAIAPFSFLIIGDVTVDPLKTKQNSTGKFFLDASAEDYFNL